MSTGLGGYQAPPLTRSSVGTLHHQLYQTLSDLITGGSVKAGDQLPTEAELVESYGVSRTTARRALDELRRQGVVERRPGKGTFVLPRRLDAAIPNLRSITDEIEQLGYRAGIVPLSADLGVADEAVAGHLRIRPGDPVLVVSRIRTADDQPVYVGTSTLNLAVFPQLRDLDYSSLGMYPLFEMATGRQVVRATQWLSAVSADAAVARSLGLRPKAPVLKLERVVYLEGDLPVESVVGYFHGDIYRHYSESERAKR